MNWLITPAYAQAPGGAGGMSAQLLQFAPIILIFIVFYFLFFRPQQQKQKETKTMLSQLRRGDRVVTGGGIMATVNRVKEGSDEIEVEIAPNVRVTVLRSTINNVVTPKPANDTVPSKA
jgi:preprotein translocase subunit YajC